MRTKLQKYPDFTAEIEAIESGGITDALLNRIIDRHAPNADYNKKLIERYEALEDSVPIFRREPRFAKDDAEKREIINHRINNDFVSKIVNARVGYSAGSPVSYSYSNGDEALEDTGDAGDSTAEMEQARDAASKALTDFVARVNMFDKDMQVTKYACICGYAGRLFYINPNGDVDVMVSPPNETIVLSKMRDMTRPTYGVRYYTITDINDVERVKAEFYDDNTVYYAEGFPGALHIVRTEPNLFGCCPLQGVPNNDEIQGDIEKVLSLIDAYDRTLSDANNEIDSFANAYMVFENINIDDEEMRRMQASGAFQFFTGGTNGGKVYFLTKEINDGFIEHHLEHLEQNILQFSQTPNMTDESFGTASGVAMKYKLLDLEFKCGMFDAKLRSAGTYMFELLAKVWEKKQIKIDPLLCVMEPKRNFPLDLLNEAQAAQAMLAAKMPQRAVYSMAFSGVDDVESIMEEIERERDSIPDLMQELPEDNEDDKRDEAEVRT